MARTGTYGYVQALYRQLDEQLRQQAALHFGQACNTLPRKRTRAELLHLPRYYDLRNHVVDFLITRAKPGDH